jgi:hypothetical protein
MDRTDGLSGSNGDDAYSTAEDELDGSAGDEDGGIVEDEDHGGVKDLDMENMELSELDDDI